MLAVLSQTPAATADQLTYNDDSCAVPASAFEELERQAVKAYQQQGAWLQTLQAACCVTQHWNMAMVSSASCKYGVRLQICVISL
jgi:hypothetical protein